MIKHIHTLTLAAALAAAASAGIYEDNSGLDEINMGNWSTAQTMAGDNVDRGGPETESWLDGNGMHFFKESYTGRNGGSTAAPGFAGVYKGNNTDVTQSMGYTFVAPAAISEQRWQAKGTITRFDDQAFSGRLQFSVNVNGSGFTNVASSGWFGRIVDGADYEMGTGDGGYGYDGPLSNIYTTELSSLNIQSGDNVVYRFSNGQLDELSGTEGEKTGMGVQLIPEPGTMLLLVMGTGFLYWKRRRD